MEQVASRVSRGEAEEFQHIVRATSARLVRLAARILGSQEEAEDVVQEAYVKAYRSLVSGQFDGRAAIGTWLFRIVSNGAIDALRSRARRPVPTDRVPDGQGDGIGSAEAHLALRELDDWLGELPAEQRAALVLKAVEGLESAEIAKILGCTEGAVEQRLVRARAQLRRRRNDDE
ncbi:MAG: RNA polymerase sigma factor [Polyangiaceae bacterium]|nr:RNA polymerase sigma factor [Polyangiaceae bacterium]